MHDFEADPVRRRRTEGSPREGKGAESDLNTLRRKFREADERLAVALVELHEGRATREQCLLALVRQQQRHDRYMTAVLARVGRLRR